MSILGVLNKRFKDTLKRVYLYVFEYRLRSCWLKRTYKQMLSVFPTVKPLTGEQKNKLKSKWGKYKNSKSFLVYNQYYEGNDLENFVPMEYFLFKFEPFFNKTFECRMLGDKNYYELLFHDVRQPQTIVRYIKGMFLDEKYNCISKEDVLQKCKVLDRVIIKIATDSMGGHGIFFWNHDDSEEELMKLICQADNVIVQEVIRQHPKMASLNEDSVNTMRLATLTFNGEVHVVSQFIRVGAKGMQVDNVSSGGMYCGIQSTGMLCDYGFDHLGRKAYNSASGVEFKGFEIPGYAKCIELVKSKAPRMAYVCNFVSWDFCIAEDGEPIMIETNFAFPDAIVNQLANGPLLGNGELLKNVLNTVGF